jgi:hypothetical protein
VPAFAIHSVQVTSCGLLSSFKQVSSLKNVQETERKKKIKGTKKRGGALPVLNQTSKVLDDEVGP